MDFPDLKEVRVPLCDITLFTLPESTLSNKPMLRIRKPKTDSSKAESYSLHNPKKIVSTGSSSSGGSSKRGRGSPKKRVNMKRKLSVEDSEPKLSEYEMMIQRNKEERTAFLEFLKVNELKEELATAVSSLKPKKPPAKTNKAQIIHGPVRKSLRLANVGINMSERSLLKKATDAALAEIAQQQIVSRVSLPSELPFEESLQGNENTLQYSEFLDIFDDIKCTNTNREISYKSDVKNLVFSHTSKVTDSRINCMDFHPTTDSIVLCTGSKHGKVGLWNVNSDSDAALFNLHIRGVTNLKFNLEKPEEFFTSSYDGTIRSGDLEKKIFNEVLNVANETSCNYFDLLSSASLLVAHGNGKVSIVDTHCRNSRAKMHHCHDTAIKTVSVHPVNKNYFVTADSKGAIYLWDLRKLKEKPLKEIRHHKRSVNSAFFSPVTGKSILTTSWDDTVCIFDTSKLFYKFPLKVQMRHNNNTGRWLFPFKANWLPYSEDAFVIGSMLTPRRIDIYNSDMEKFHTFVGDHVQCISSVNTFHRNLPVLASTNASGRVDIYTKNL